MKKSRFNSLFGVTFCFLVFVSLAVVPQLAAAPKENGHITTPKEFLGHEPGEDYYLANYSEDLLPYWELLARQSNRMKLVNIGVTSGLEQPFKSPPYQQPMVMAIISSPDNLARLDYYKGINRQLALAKGLTDDQARALASQGKAIVWIDSSMHATEYASVQSLIKMVYLMVSQNDEETLRILDDVIFLAVPSNPDGMELVSNWYMHDHVTGLPQTDPLKRSTSSLPVLYQKYIAHDNNRDYFTFYMPEAQAIARQLNSEWFPQIVYTQHQSGPTGKVLFYGTVRDPYNYNLDNLIITGLQSTSSSVISQMIAGNYPGATNRTGGSYSAWHNGMVRTTAYFHNQVGLLSEITGTATPTRISFRPDYMVAQNDYPFPTPPVDVWHLSDAVDYLLTIDYAHLDLASKNRENYLYNMYRMGMNSIEKGSQDNYTFYGVLIDQFKKNYPSGTYQDLLNTTPKDPRGYIIPSDQPDFLTAIKFANMLLRSGVVVERATSGFSVGGKAYPSGSLVVRAAQAFRTCVRDAFEPLWHPYDIAYPGASPTAPYDIAGYTMAFQMGVQYDKIYDAFAGPFEKITLSQWDGTKWLDEIEPPAGVTVTTRGTAGYFLSHQVNDAFIAVNRLMKIGAEVYWLKNPTSANGKTYPAGTMYIPSTPSVIPILQQLAEEKGLNFEAVASKPTGAAAFKLNNMRIGIADVYGGNSSEGWTEWMLGQFEFPLSLVYPQEINAGNLHAKYDVLIFEDGTLPSWNPTSGNCAVPDTTNYADRYKNRVGSYYSKCVAGPLKEFLDAGGTILAVDSSTNLRNYPAFGLPTIPNPVSGLPRTQYYVPGSVLQVALDTSLPITYGMPDHISVFSDSSAVFAPVSASNISKIAWFDSATPLQSGWAIGQQLLQPNWAALQADIGQGTLFLFGQLIDFRAQGHAAYKFFFNGIYYGGLTDATIQ